jgi:hypothetical protein
MPGARVCLLVAANAIAPGQMLMVATALYCAVLLPLRPLRERRARTRRHVATPERRACCA